jgi:glycosyltransferase involved in cell wall biosynthesis
MAQKINPEYIFETSWEVCNLVGGIYTVLSTRAATLSAAYGDKLIFIGPDVWKDFESPYFEESEDLLNGWKDYVKKEYSLNIRIGRWLVPGTPVSVLVDFCPLMSQKDQIYGQIWEQEGVESLYAYGDYDESSMFGYSTGIVIESYFKFFKLSSKHQVVAHFNEWMTTFGAFYIKSHVPSIATIFTTHATSIGRSIAGNKKPLYDYLKAYNGNQMAYELNMVSKHSTEKAGAHTVDCFTTVSDITGRESEQLLELKPHIITPNGFEDVFVPKAKAFTNGRKQAREVLRNVAEVLLDYNLNDNPLFVCTAGRYEYRNKGLDTLLDGLKILTQNHTLDRDVVVFIMVPAHISGYRKDLAKALEKSDRQLNSWNKFTTHDLFNYDHDQIMSAIRWHQFTNSEHERVKIIFVPSYLNGNDGIFNMTYYQLLIGMDISVFASYYEPWGYTPLESVAFHVPTITTDLSGFGQWVSSEPQNIDSGVGIIHRTDFNSYEVSEGIADMIFQFLSMDKNKVEQTRKNASDIAEKALWKHFIQYYQKAYQIALANKNNRIK